MLQVQLKESTKSLHDQLEQLMFVDEIMQRTLTLQQYKQVLITNYLIHQHYEDVLFERLSEPISKELDAKSRVKLPALLLDLKEVNLQAKDLITTNKLQGNNPPTEAFALGALYVLEGATLGGSVIYKQLLQNPNFPSTLGLHYYRSYGQELMPKWKQFVGVINNLPLATHKDVLAGAMMMFKEIAKVASNLN